jgi:hypothetical protein
MKAKRIFLSSFLVLAFCLTGCSVKIVNTTPDIAPASPTGNYTLSAHAQVKKQTVVPSSLKAFVVIDGEQRAMTATTTAPNLFEYDYQAPVGKELTRFYYVLNFDTQKKDETPTSVQIISDLYQVQLPSQITLTIDKTRAAVGTRVSINGQGFTNQDTVFVDRTPAETVFTSPTKLQFVVPELKPDFGYSIEVRSSTRAQTAGYLRIDPASPLSVLPNQLSLKPGQRQALAFALDYPASDGGLYINITTDIPGSIIMPEVLIPEGARSVSAVIEGGRVGSGHLFINVSGLPELVIPLTIR